MSEQGDKPCLVEIKVFDNSPNGCTIVVDRPAIIKNHVAVKEWAAAASAQLAICTYAGGYKKKLTAESPDRTQAPLWTDEHKNLFEAMHNLVPEGNRLDIGALPSRLSGTVPRLWHWGYSEGLQMIDKTPNGLGLWKLLAEGQIDWMVVDSAKLAAAIRSIKAVEQVSLTAMTAFLENLDAGPLEKCRDAGCLFYVGTQHKTEVIYAPPAWICIERVVAGLLIYGVRQAVIWNHTACASSYEELIGIMANTSGVTSTEKMREVLAWMRPEDSG